VKIRTEGRYAFNLFDFNYVRLGQLAAWELPSSVLDVNPNELLSMWERMRRALYGGGSSQTVKGLYVDNCPTSGGVVRKKYDQFNDENLTKLISNSWFYEATGAVL
jgi:hypothetical protein